MATAKLNDVDPQPGLPMCWPGSSITRSPISLRCCRGIGAMQSVSSRLPTMAAPSQVFTISRAAEILGEDEEVLWDLATEMEPEDGHLWIYRTGDQQIPAFTDRGLECLQEPIAEHKRTPSSPRS